MSGIKIIIDASNIRSGGGLKHLQNILCHYDPDKHNIRSVVLFSNKRSISYLPALDHVIYTTHSLLNYNPFLSYLFQAFWLPYFCRKMKADVLFVPGSSFIGSFHPFVTISQNLLPFEKLEIKRFKSIRNRIRFHLLRMIQSLTFKKADGVIFLTRYARKIISKNVRTSFKDHIIIGHGTEKFFQMKVKVQKPIEEYSAESPFRLLYISNVAPYKHQSKIAEATLRLREKGYPVVLEIIGSSDNFEMNSLKAVQSKHSNIKGVLYHGSKSSQELVSYYKLADAFIFGSTCENQPITLLEAIAAKLPILCSIYGPMPEVLRDCGKYFDPTNVENCERVIENFLNDLSLRELIVNRLANRNVISNWSMTATNTFKYLEYIAMSYDK